MNNKKLCEEMKARAAYSRSAPIPCDERAQAESDTRLYGHGFLLDGKRVAPDRIQVLRFGAVEQAEAAPVAHSMIRNRDILVKTESTFGTDTAPGAGVNMILDACCGSRMMWFDKADPRAVFGDKRIEVLTVTDNSRGNASGQRTLRIEPDTLMDFRAMPFADGAFRLVAFDPPHLETAGPRSWLAAKYGKLSADWRADLAAGFAECFRVLETHGVLVFKWNETQVKLAEVLRLTPHAPLFGQVSGRSGMTHWLVFMKPETEARP